MTIPYAEGPLCPGDKAGDCETALGAPASVITALSSAPSLLLCALVIYAHLRSAGAGTSRSIITCIAAANFLASLSYVMGSFNYWAHQKALAYTPDCNRHFLPACQIQSFVTCTSVMMSMIWSAILSIQLYQSVVKGRMYLERRGMLLCHLVGWGLPTLVSFALLVGGELGYSTVTASSWCLVADANTDDAAPKPIWKIVLLVFVAGMFVELCAYVVIVTCTVLVVCHREVSGCDAGKTVINLWG